MERGLRAKANIIEDTSTKELFDNMGIEIKDETKQTLTKLSEVWDSFSQEEKDKLIDTICTQLNLRS